MSFIDERRALTREKRLSTLSNFNGTLSGIQDETSGEEIKQKIRTLSQVTYDEVLYAARLLSTIKETAVVVHGATGCAAANIAYNADYRFEWYSTNLEERDTILGGDEKLRRAVTRAVNETHARVIFVLGTPVVAINNDDISSMILELEDELDVKIISIYTDGFKSKSATTGYDIITHSVLKYIVDKVKPEDEKENFVNLISFSENPYDIEAITSVLDELTIDYNLLLQYADLDNIKKASKAKASIVLNPDEGGYLAEELEEVYGVKYIKTGAPIGIHNTNKFFRRLAREFQKEDQALEYIEKRTEIAQEIFSDDSIRGKHLFISGTPSQVQGLNGLVEKLGGVIDGIQIPYIDLESREYINKLSGLNPGTNVVIGIGQYFEVANVISKGQFDYFITSNSDVEFLEEYDVKPVIISELPIYGYKGIEAFVNAINSSSLFYERRKSIYKASWLRKSSNWYVKQEVR